MSDTHKSHSCTEGSLASLDVNDDISDVSWMDFPVLIILVLLILLVAVQFFTRYVLNDSLGWTEEIARYFLIALGFVGSVSCVRKGKHIFLEFFYRYIPRNRIKTLAISAETVTVVFYAVFACLAFVLAEKTSAQSMVSVDLPKSLIYYVVGISSVLMSVFSALKLFSIFRSDAEQVADDKLDIQI